MFVKPENAINIPEKYKIQIDNMKKEMKEKTKQKIIHTSIKKPVRIRPNTTPFPAIDFAESFDLTMVSSHREKLF